MHAPTNGRFSLAGHLPGELDTSGARLVGRPEGAGSALRLSAKLEVVALPQPILGRTPEGPTRVI